MDSRPVGIMDSGVGGMTVLKPMAEYLPCESVVYFGDSLRMPYGNKEPEEIVRLADAMIAFLEERDCKAILVGCNTISSYIDRLRSNVPLFSIVEAGVSAACALPDECVGLIATLATVREGLYERLLAARAPEKRLVANSSVSLPKIIDSYLDEKSLLEESIREVIDPVFERESGVKSLILGCSHFPIIAAEIAELYPGIRLIDPSETQVLAAREFLREAGLLAEGPASLVLYTTAETYEYAAAIRRLKLEIDALIKVVLDV